jgi:hypothetical protein
MIVTHYLNPQTHEQYATLAFSTLRIDYLIDRLGCLSLIEKTPENPETIACYELNSHEANDLLISIRDLIGKYEQNIKIIAPKLGWKVIGEGAELCLKFQEWIEHNEILESEDLNLSNLALTCLPPHLFGLKKLKNLNLSNNKLRVLPPNLRTLNHLELLNLKGNPILKLPSWIEERKQLRVEFKDKEDQQDWAQLGS